MAWAEKQPRLWLAVDEILQSTFEIFEKTWFRQRNNHDHGALFMKEFTTIETVESQSTPQRRQRRRATAPEVQAALRPRHSVRVSSLGVRASLFWRLIQTRAPLRSTTGSPDNLLAQCAPGPVSASQYSKHIVKAVVYQPVTHIFWVKSNCQQHHQQWRASPTAAGRRRYVAPQKSRVYALRHSRGHCCCRRRHRSGPASRYGAGCLAESFFGG